MFIVEQLFVIIVLSSNAFLVMLEYIGLVGCVIIVRLLIFNI